MPGPQICAIRGHPIIGQYVKDGKGFVACKPCTDAAYASQAEGNPRRSGTKTQDQAEAEAMLRKFLKPGDTVHTILRHVSKSGMARDISLYTFQNNQPIILDGYAARFLGYPRAKREGIRIGGAGMDMGFALVYELSRGLFGDPNALRNGGWMEAAENPAKDPRPFVTLTKQHVGKPSLHAFGRSWLVSDFIGQVLLQDVGKRVYLVGDILQVENNEQRAQRLGQGPSAEANFRKPPPQIHFAPTSTVKGPATWCGVEVWKAYTSPLVAGVTCKNCLKQIEISAEANPGIVCATCGEESGGKGTSMYGSVHKYGPTTHPFKPKSGAEANILPLLAAAVVPAVAKEIEKRISKKAAANPSVCVVCGSTVPGNIVAGGEKLCPDHYDSFRKCLRGAHGLKDQYTGAELYGCLAQVMKAAGVEGNPVTKGVAVSTIMQHVKFAESEARAGRFDGGMKYLHGASGGYGMLTRADTRWFRERYPTIDNALQYGAKIEDLKNPVLIAGIRRELAAWARTGDPTAAWMPHDTGGGFMGLIKWEKANNHYLITAWPEGGLPVVGQPAMIGYYDNNGEVWLRKIPKYTNPSEAFGLRARWKPVTTEENPRKKGPKKETPEEWAARLAAIPCPGASWIHIDGEICECDPRSQDYDSPKKPGECPGASPVHEDAEICDCAEPRFFEEGFDPEKNPLTKEEAKRIIQNAKSYHRASDNTLDPESKAELRGVANGLEMATRLAGTGVEANPRAKKIQCLKCGEKVPVSESVEIGDGDYCRACAVESHDAQEHKEYVSGSSSGECVVCEQIKAFDPGFVPMRVEVIEGNPKGEPVPKSWSSGGTKYRVVGLCGACGDLLIWDNDETCLGCNEYERRCQCRKTKKYAAQPGFRWKAEENPRAVEACEFVRRQPHEWFCETHKSLKIAGTSAPVFCDVAAHQRGISEANPRTGSPYTLQSFVIGGIAGPFKGYTDHSTWNGWATPWFLFDEAQKVANRFKGRYDKATDSFIITDPEMDPEFATEVFKGDTIRVGNANVRAYPIGSWSWTWEIAGENAAENPHLPYAKGTIPRGVEKLHPYNKILANFRKQYGRTKGRGFFYAWLRGVSPKGRVPPAEPAMGRRGPEENPVIPEGEKRSLIEAKVTLDGRPAVISGDESRSSWGTVGSLDPKYPVRHEWSWPAIKRIVEAGGAFKSQWAEENPKSRSGILKSATDTLNVARSHLAKAYNAPLASRKRLEYATWARGNADMTIGTLIAQTEDELFDRPPHPMASKPIHEAALKIIEEADKLIEPYGKAAITALKTKKTKRAVGATVRWSGDRIVGCESKNHSKCRPYEESTDGLWTCPTCGRGMCMEEGGGDSPECDDCWAKREKAGKSPRKWGPNEPSANPGQPGSPGFDRFVAVYGRKLHEAVVSHPQEYAWPVSDVPVVMGRMIPALQRGGYNKDSRAFRETCKELGIKHTYGAINAYLTGAEENPLDSHGRKLFQPDEAEDANGEVLRVGDRVSPSMTLYQIGGMPVRKKEVYTIEKIENGHIILREMAAIQGAWDPSVWFRRNGAEANPLTEVEFGRFETKMMRIGRKAHGYLDRAKRAVTSLHDAVMDLPMKVPEENPRRGDYTCEGCDAEISSVEAVHAPGGEVYCESCAEELGIDVDENPMAAGTDVHSVAEAFEVLNDDRSHGNEFIADAARELIPSFRGTRRTSEFIAAVEKRAREMEAEEDELMGMRCRSCGQPDPSGAGECVVCFPDAEANPQIDYAAFDRVARQVPGVVARLAKPWSTMGGRKLVDYEIVRQHFIKKGYSEQAADDILNLAQDKGIIHEPIIGYFEVPKGAEENPDPFGTMLETGWGRGAMHPSRISRRRRQPKMMVHGVCPACDALNIASAGPVGSICLQHGIARAEENPYVALGWKYPGGQRQARTYKKLGSAKRWADWTERVAGYPRVDIYSYSGESAARWHADQWEKGPAEENPSLREFIRANRKEIDAAIQRVVPGIRLNDEDRRQWILNDEGLYNWARSERVPIEENPLTRREAADITAKADQQLDFAYGLQGVDDERFNLGRGISRGMMSVVQTHGPGGLARRSEENPNGDTRERIAWERTQARRGRSMSRSCPTCGRTGVLSAYEAAQGYQCRSCTARDEGPMAEANPARMSDILESLAFYVVDDAGIGAATTRDQAFAVFQNALTIGETNALHKKYPKLVRYLEGGIGAPSLKEAQRDALKILGTLGYSGPGISSRRRRSAEENPWYEIIEQDSGQALEDRVYGKTRLQGAEKALASLNYSLQEVPGRRRRAEENSRYFSRPSRAEANDLKKAAAAMARARAHAARARAAMQGRRIVDAQYREVEANPREFPDRCPNCQRPGEPYEPGIYICRTENIRFNEAGDVLDFAEENAALISHDPFSRQDLMREVGTPGSCRWCGQPARFYYYGEGDYRRGRSEGPFCSVGDYRTFFSNAEANPIGLLGGALLGGIASGVGFAAASKAMGNAEENPRRAAWDLPRLRQEIEKHRARWAATARENGWYKEPFYIQVWLLKDGTIRDSVAFRDMTADIYVNYDTDHEIRNPFTGAAPPRRPAVKAPTWTPAPAAPRLSEAVITDFWNRMSRAARLDMLLSGGVHPEDASRIARRNWENLGADQDDRMRRSVEHEYEYTGGRPMEAEENPSTVEVDLSKAAAAFETFHQGEPRKIRKVKMPIMSKALTWLGSWYQQRYFGDKWGRTDQAWNGKKGHYYYHDPRPGTRTAREATVAWDPVSKHVIAWAPMRITADGVDDVK